MRLEFSRQIFESNQIWNFMKIRPVGAELFHAGRWTDRHNEAIVAFPSMAKAPKNQIKQFWTGNILEASFRDRQVLNYVRYHFVSYGFPQGKNFLKATSDYFYLNF